MVLLSLMAFSWVRGLSKTNNKPMAAELKLSRQRSHWVEVSRYRRRYKGNFHDESDLHAALGDWPFLVSAAAIVFRSAKITFSTTA
jgi:hypothetical protein